MGEQQKNEARRDRELAKFPSYEEREAAHRAKKLTNAELKEFIQSQAKIIAKQGNELVRLRAELATANESAVKYAAIDRTVNLLAKLRLKRDLATVIDKQLESERQPNIRGSMSIERERCTTLPQALAAEMDRLLESVDKVSCEEDERAEFMDQIAELDVERRGFLEVLGLDEHEWRHKHAWKYGG